MMLSLLVVILGIGLCSSQDVRVRIQQGELVGTTAFDKNGGKYYSFLSIPYAKPPVGELRFALPQKAGPWEGVFNATYKRPVCAQLARGVKLGSEDCLYVNVHTPRILTHFPKPVIFYIHGGSYFLGNSQDHGADYLMIAGVVLVTVNYRLGPFGFLSSDDVSLGISGNTALKDQVMALKWVRDNIRSFGGDPGNVMVMGESVGGVSAHLHMLSPTSKGLFHSVVAMSGSAEMGFSEGAPYSLEPVTKRLGIQVINRRMALDDLRKLTTEEILEAERAYDPNGAIAEQFECSVIIEKPVPGAFITQRPLDIIKSGKYNHVPLMLGYTNIDGLYADVVSYLNWGVARLITNFSLSIPHSIKKDRVNTTAAGIEIGEFYLGKNNETQFDIMSRADLLTGISMVGPLSRVLAAQIPTSKQPVYFYVFSADTKMNYIKTSVPQIADAKGAIHSEDLAYLFKRGASPSFEKGSVEEKAIDNVVKTFTDFAKNRKPGGKWKRVTKGKFNYMNIGIESIPGVNPDREAFEFWNRWNEKYFIYK